MSPIDWIIVGVPLVIVLCIAGATRKYNKSVADFLAGGRCAGRYLIANARGEGGAALITVIALFEYYAKSGFTMLWWTAITVPVALLVAITGFVVYRYRETRSLTVGQFFEIRYSHRFRLFMGVLAMVAGLLNYGIFPAVGGKFFVYFLRLPEVISMAGLSLPTWTLIAAGYLCFMLYFALTGGQISVLISDCLEGIFSMLAYMAITIAVLLIFRWSDIVTVLARAPAGESKLNPFDTNAAADFNIWYVLIVVVSNLYSTMAWQSGHAFNSSGLNPHEVRMAGILGNWRNLTRNVMVTILAVCALTFMEHAKFAGPAAPAATALQSISSVQMQTQMQVPVALSYMLPIGIKGLFCAVMIMGLLAGDAATVHSWGSVFIQDVVLPMRRKPLTPAQHIRLLRWSMIGVASFAFCFSILFRQTQYIVMWFTITGALFMSGAGSAIIGGLYWTRGTTAAAWSAVLVGSSTAFAGIIAKQIDPHFFLNSAYVSIIAIALAVVTYVIVSLLTCREPYDLERMLHRGRYALANETAVQAQPRTRRTGVFALLGINREFTRADVFVALSIFVWGLLWVVVLVVGCLWNSVRPWPLAWWADYWLVAGVALPLLIAMGTAIWFSIGGLRDVRLFFARLRVEKRDDRDDGTVINHRNWDETSQIDLTS